MYSMWKKKLNSFIIKWITLNLVTNLIIHYVLKIDTSPINNTERVKKVNK